MTRVLAPTPENLASCAQSLARGEIGGLPTETVYGLAADALNASAVARVFAAKERPHFDPLIVHVADASSLKDLEDAGLVKADRFSFEARSRVNRLIAHFWPGPLTLVLPKSAAIPDLVTSGLGTVGIRMPDHAVARELIRLSGHPLAAPSANRFGRISPTEARAVLEELRGRIDWVLDGGPCRVGVESTVLAVDASGALACLRPGGVTTEEIASALKLSETEITRRTPTSSAGAPQAQASPGLIESHYAPEKPVILLPARLRELDESAWKKLAQHLGPRPLLLLSSGDPSEAARALAAWGITVAQAFTLSRSGDDHEAARSLFSTLRELDRVEGAPILVEPYPGERGLGHAIADRLRRAAAKRP